MMLLICDNIVMTTQLNNFTALLLSLVQCFFIIITERTTRKAGNYRTILFLNELPLFAIAPTRWQCNNAHPFAHFFIFHSQPDCCCCCCRCRCQFTWVCVYFFSLSVVFQVCLQPQLDPFSANQTKAGACDSVWQQIREKITRTHCFCATNLFQNMWEYATLTSYNNHI